MKTTKTTRVAPAAAAKTTRKYTKATPVAVPARPWSFAAMREAIAAYEAPVYVSVTVSLLAGFLVAGSTYYAGMLVISAIMTWVIGMTASAFLAFIIYFLGLIITLMLSIYAGAQAQQWIINGGPKAIIAAPSKFIAWLGRAREAVAKTA